MSTTFIWAAVLSAIAITVFLCILVFGVSDPQKKEPVTAADVSINAAEGSIVTVRKVGRTTRVVIRSDIHDHWEGADGIDLSPTPIEITKQEEPELYAEYMSPKTSAVRKYEIADYIYSLGLTLPYIRGLHENWRRERDHLADASPDPSQERTPISPAGGKMHGGIVYRKLDINHSLREEPVGDMEPGDVPDSEEEEEEVQQQPSQNNTNDEKETVQ